jgi:TolB-like protein/DNA-binding winged helix-turn-helix (wHTH) protein
MDRQHYEFGPFVLDLRRKLLLKNGVPLQPGQRGMALLEAMLAGDGRPVSKTDLMDAAWPGMSVEESNLSVQIAALRKLLGTAPGGGEWIITVQRLGYQLVLPTPADPSTAPQPMGGDVLVRPAEEGRPSIAVLPFDNMSPDPTHSFFADGITDEITTALSRLKSFFVIARNTMFTYKGKPVNIQTLGVELGVRYILEGSVRSASGRIRVSAQLIDSASGSHIWGERYDPGRYYSKRRCPHRP